MVFMIFFFDFFYLENFDFEDTCTRKIIFKITQHAKHSGLVQEIDTDLYNEELTVAYIAIMR